MSSDKSETATAKPYFLHECVGPQPRSSSTYCLPSIHPILRHHLSHRHGALASRSLSLIRLAWTPRRLLNTINSSDRFPRCTASIWPSSANKMPLLLPLSLYDHSTVLEDGNNPLVRPIYLIFQVENFANERILPSQSSARAPIMFIKKDGAVYLAVDYRSLNRLGGLRRLQVQKASMRVRRVSRTATSDIR